jgi:hypothetical protein
VSLEDSAPTSDVNCLVITFASADDTHRYDAHVSLRWSKEDGSLYDARTRVTLPPMPAGESPMAWSRAVLREIASRL